MSEEKIIDIKKIPRKSEALFEWKAKEAKFSRKKIIWLAVLAMLIIAYLIFAKNYFGTLVIFLCYAVFYLYYGREGRESYFAIKDEGVQIIDRIFKFESLKSFRIIYRAGGPKELKMLSKKKLMPEISLPIGDADPLKIKEVLLKFLPEKE